MPLVPPVTMAVFPESENNFDAETIVSLLYAFPSLINDIISSSLSKAS